MYGISNAFKAELANGNFNYAISLAVTFSDQTTLTITNSDIWSGSVEFENAISSDSGFQVGSCIADKMTFALNNMDGRFTNYDFLDAKIIAYIGIIINGVATEFFRKGTYIVDSVTGRNTYSIQLTCLDNAIKFDKLYSLVATSYPATLDTIVRNICTACSVLLPDGFNFPNKNFVVNVRPKDESLTCRQIISWVSQIACSYAKMDSLGRLTFKWYNTTTVADAQHTFSSLYSIDTGELSISITGVRVTEEIYETANIKKQQYLYGSEGYVLDISGNKLIQSGSARDVAEFIGDRVIGVQFWSIKSDVLTNPDVEAGDTGILIDNFGTNYFFPITQVTFRLESNTSVACRAQSPLYKNSTQPSASTSTLIAARETAAAQLSQYDLEMQKLTTLITESFGVFKTEQVQPDGSVIYILHNKPTLTESKTQWKMTAGALAVSNDYGQTWQAGIDSSGNAVVNVLSAIGVNARWINSGAIEVTDPSGTETLFFADYDTGTVQISGDNVYIGSTSVADAISQLSGALIISLSNESQGIPVDADGEYSTFPDVSTRIYVTYGSTDVTSSCQLTATPVNITGNLTPEEGYYLYTPSSLNADTGYVAFTAIYNTGTDSIRTSKRFNLYKVKSGARGPAGTGEPASIYFIESSADIIKQGEDEIYVPPSITFNAFSRTGSSADRTAYSGLFKVEETTDGVNWTVVEEPIVNKTSTVYTPSDTNVAAVRCTLYSTADIKTTYFGLAAGDETAYIADDDEAMLYLDQDDVAITGGDQLDIQTVAVVKDVSALSQDKVFDILTDGGTLQGIIYREGEVYINASYIASGIIRSVSPNTYWNLETGALNIDKGSITLGNNFSVSSSGILNASGATINGAITATSLTLAGNASIPSTKIDGLSSYILKDGTIGNPPADSPTEGATGFVVSSAGLLQASNAVIKGTIYASAGTIAGWMIKGTYLGKGTLGSNGSIYLYPAGITTNVAGKSNISGLVLIAGPNFGVTSNGKLYASDVDVMGKVTATSGYIGTSSSGFTIDGTSIYSGSKSGTSNGNLTLSNADFTRSLLGGDKSGLRFAIGSKFGVDNTGKVYASDVDVRGVITANSGYLGTNSNGFTIDSYGIYSGAKDNPTAGYITLSNGNFSRAINGTSRSGLRFAIGANFGVDNTGKVYSANMYATGVDITGKITATQGFIGNANGGFTIDGTSIYSGSKSGTNDGNLTLSNADFTRSVAGVSNVSTLRFAIGSKFGVTKEGKVYASDAEIKGIITANSGYLGTSSNGFHIDSYGIYSGSKDGTTAGYITLSNGNFSRAINGISRSGLRLAIGANFGVDNSGKVYTAGLVATGADIAGKITATQGKIGRFDITNTYLMTGSGSTAAGMGGDMAFWAGGTQSASAPFRVAYNGSFVATNGSFKGTINAHSTITSSNITGGTVDGATITSDSGTTKTQISGATITLTDTGAESNYQTAGTISPGRRTVYIGSADQDGALVEHNAATIKISSQTAVDLWSRGTRALSIYSGIVEIPTKLQVDRIVPYSDIDSPGSNFNLKNGTLTLGTTAQNGTLSFVTSSYDGKTYKNIRINCHLVVNGSAYQKHSISVGGSGYASSGWVSGSDERKKDINEWDNKIDKFIMNLPSIVFYWKDTEEADSEIHCGLGAQRTLALLQEYDMEQYLVRYDEESDVYAVAYQELAPMMLPSLQENRKRIEQLEQENEELKIKVKTLEMKLAKVCAMLGIEEE